MSVAHYYYVKPCGSENTGLYQLVGCDKIKVSPPVVALVEAQSKLGWQIGASTLCFLGDWNDLTVASYEIPSGRPLNWQRQEQETAILTIICI